MKSKCCGEGYRTAIDYEGEKYYTCVKCGKQCDLVPPKLSVEKVLLLIDCKMSWIPRHERKTIAKEICSAYERGELFE